MKNRKLTKTQQEILRIAKEIDAKGEKWAEDAHKEFLLLKNKINKLDGLAGKRNQKRYYHLYDKDVGRYMAAGRNSTTLEHLKEALLSYLEPGNVDIEEMRNWTLNELLEFFEFSIAISSKPISTNINYEPDESDMDINNGLDGLAGSKKMTLEQAFEKIEEIKKFHNSEIFTGGDIDYGGRGDLQGEVEALALHFVDSHEPLYMLELSDIFLKYIDGDIDKAEMKKDAKQFMHLYNQLQKNKLNGLADENLPNPDLTEIVNSDENNSTLNTQNSTLPDVPIDIPIVDIPPITIPDNSTLEGLADPAESLLYSLYNSLKYKNNKIYYDSIQKFVTLLKDADEEYRDYDIYQAFDIMDFNYHNENEEVWLKIQNDINAELDRQNPDRENMSGLADVPEVKKSTDLNKALKMLNSPFYMTVAKDYKRKGKNYVAVYEPAWKKRGTAADPSHPNISSASESSVASWLRKNFGTSASLTSLKRNPVEYAEKLLGKHEAKTKKVESRKEKKQSKVEKKREEKVKIVKEKPIHISKPVKPFKPEEHLKPVTVDIEKDYGLEPEPVIVPEPPKVPAPETKDSDADFMELMKNIAKDLKD